MTRDQTVKDDSPLNVEAGQKKEIIAQILDEPSARDRLVELIAEELKSRRVQPAWRPGLLGNYRGSRSPKFTSTR